MNTHSSGYYSIDKDYNILSYNDTAKQLYPNLQPEVKCYKALMGLDSPCPPCPDPGDTAHLMSGRCAIYYCLRDLMLTDQKRVAYLPSYDCETVLGCFVKAGYEIHYYDFDKNLSPVFEEEMIPQISVLLVCGYYGYTTYNEDFVKKCKASGVSERLISPTRFFFTEISSSSRATGI